MNRVRSSLLALALMAAMPPAYADVTATMATVEGNRVELHSPMKMPFCKNPDTALELDKNHEVVRRGCYVLDRKTLSVTILWEDGEIEEADPALFVVNTRR